MNELFVIDGENGILGRVAALAAKNALQGRKAIVLNCEKVLISGRKDYIIKNYLQLRQRPHVKFPSQPDQIVKRTIRGMIKYTSGRGEDAFKKVRCYKGTPEEYKNAEKVKFESKRDFMKVEELSRMLK